VPAPPADTQLIDAAFTDTRHGTVTMATPAGGLATYVTSDGGRTWRGEQSRARYSLNGGSVLVEVPLRQPGGGRRLSLDGGRTWRPVQLPQGTVGPIAFADDVHGWVLAMRARQEEPDERPLLWRTNDGGWTWVSAAGAGLPPVWPAAQLAFADPAHGVLVTGPFVGDQTVAVTDDGGETWRPSIGLRSSVPGFGPLRVSVLRRGGRLLAWLTLVAADQVDAQGRLVLASPDERFRYQELRYASDDGGRTWSAGVPGPPLMVRTLAGEPVLDDRGRLLLFEDRRLWVSEDDGASWTARVAQLPADIASASVVRAAGGALLAAGVRVGSRLPVVRALLLSADGGAHWTEIRPPGG
jgi:photosystem II stability/assembly factor-like uncharacterized protein